MIKKLRNDQKVIKKIFTTNFVEFLIDKSTATKEIIKKK